MKTTKNLVAHLAAAMLVSLDNWEDYYDRANHRIILGKDWFEGFLRRNRHQIKLVSAKTTEDCRLKWSTSQNLRHHFKMVKQEMIDLGIAYENPGYKSDDFYRQATPPTHHPPCSRSPVRHCTS